MRIAIVDDLADERALLREQLAQQLARRGAEAELLEFDSGEAFLAAEKERRFTAAFLDIYMEGMTGMEAARTLRKTDTDCLLVFTTTSTDHALEGFQVRALHYLVKPFAEAEIDALTDELLARVPQPERFMELRVEGGEIRLRYRDIIRAEHFAQWWGRVSEADCSASVFSAPRRRRRRSSHWRQRWSISKRCVFPAGNPEPSR